MTASGLAQQRRPGQACAAAPARARGSRPRRHRTAGSPPTDEQRIDQHERRTASPRMPQPRDRDARARRVAASAAIADAEDRRFEPRSRGRRARAPRGRPRPPRPQRQPPEHGPGHRQHERHVLPGHREEVGEADAAEGVGEVGRLLAVVADHEAREERAARGSRGSAPSTSSRRTPLATAAARVAPGQLDAEHGQLATEVARHQPRLSGLDRANVPRTTTSSPASAARSPPAGRPRRASSRSACPSARRRGRPRSRDPDRSAGCTSRRPIPASMPSRPSSERCARPLARSAHRRPAAAPASGPPPAATPTSDAPIQVRAAGSSGRRPRPATASDRPGGVTRSPGRAAPRAWPRRCRARRAAGRRR